MASVLRIALAVAMLGLSACQASRPNLRVDGELAADIAVDGRPHLTAKVTLGSDRRGRDHPDR
jgi:phosphotransacetylase